MATMISGRTLAQGAGCESKMSLISLKRQLVCHLSEKDFKSLELSEGKNVLLKNEFGQVVLTAKADAGLPDEYGIHTHGSLGQCISGKGDRRMRHAPF